MGTVVEIKPEPCDGRGHISGREVPADADAGKAFNRPFAVLCTYCSSGTFEFKIHIVK